MGVVIFWRLFSDIFLQALKITKLCTNNINFSFTNNHELCKLGNPNFHITLNSQDKR